MLVSVIIPTHNAENTIARCLDSVLKQTYSEIEIICGDDCSSDKTMEILRNYSKMNNNITVFKNEKNSRAAFTRNECIKRAHGQIIAQIDDDDYMTPERITKQIRFLNEHPDADVVGSTMLYFDEEGIWKESKAVYHPTKTDFLKGSPFSNPSVIFRRECLDKVGGYRVAKETIRGQDYDLYMRLYAEGFQGYNMNEPLTYYYRGRKGYKKTNIKIRYYEFKVRWKNFKALGLFPKGIIYAFKPLILAIIPFSMLERIKRALLANKG